MTDELRHVVRLAGLTRDDLAELQRRAVRNAFAPAALKASLLETIDAWVRDPDAVPEASMTPDAVDGQVYGG